MESFNFPTFKTVTYLLNPQTGYYEKQPLKIAFNKLPFELKVEETQEEKIRKQGANEILRGRVKNGRYQFFTGLIPLVDEVAYIGNDYEFEKGKKFNSLIIAKFSEQNSKLVVYYFNRYYIDNRETLLKFAYQFIENN